MEVDTAERETLCWWIGDDWIKCWDECFSRDSSVDGGSNNSYFDSGPDARHTYYTSNSWRSGHWKIDSWHSGHWKTSYWHRKDGNYHGCDNSWSKHNIDDGWNSSHWDTVVGAKRTSVTTITVNRNGSLTHSLRL